jgi:glycosyltransferase involved in cell wall biosynthesis
VSILGGQLATLRAGTALLELRIVIVAEHASLQFGGEAALPLHYYRILRRRQIPVWLVVHERTRNELSSLFPLDGDRIVFVPDTSAHLFVWRVNRFLPDRISNFTTGFILRFLTQVAQRRQILRLVREQAISIIHQPIPVSPKEPSLIFGMHAPVIIGPMNGGMNYPPGFRKFQTRVERCAISTGRWLASFMNLLMPGKRRATMLLVANQRTRAALPQGVCSNVALLVENGVDLSFWNVPNVTVKGTASIAARFVFMGRLVDWKAVDLLLLAFKRASAQAEMSLSIIGTGEERSNLEQLASRLDILDARTDQAGKVTFLGWLSQAECVHHLASSDALVLPSMAECGGAVVLEAMAMEVPVIATAWGGPVDYLDSSCGILVEPSSEETFIDELAAALIKLANNPQLRRTMGRAGKDKVIREFDWETKVDRILELYQSCITAIEDV